VVQLGTAEAKRRYCRERLYVQPPREETGMTADLRHKDARLIETIDKLVESHPELDVIVRDVAAKQPHNATPEQVQANLQERARAIIEARPDLEHSFGD
jgi:hypothetical protein